VKARLDARRSFEHVRVKSWIDRRALVRSWHACRAEEHPVERAVGPRRGAVERLFAPGAAVPYLSERHEGTRQARRSRALKEISVAFFMKFS